MTKNILVIEGDFETGREIAKGLEGEGYFVFTASDAEVAIMMAKRVKPSLVILDPAVRGAGGMEFTKKLRAIEGVRQAPILLFAGGDREYEPGYGHIYGIVNFLKKPVDVLEITAKSRALLEDLPVVEEQKPIKKVNETGLFQEGARLADLPVLTEPAPEPLETKTKQEPGPVLPLEEEEPREETHAARVEAATPEPVSINPGKINPGKREKKPINRKNIFLFVFLFLLGAIGSFGYFFFFVPGQKEELALKEGAPTVPEMAHPMDPAPVESPAPPGAPPDNSSDNSSISAKTEEALPTPEKAKEGHFHALQLGVFGTKANAEKLAGRLEARGYNPYIKESKRGSTKTLYRVLVGRFDSPGKGGPTFTKLEKDGFNPIRYSE